MKLAQHPRVGNDASAVQADLDSRGIGGAVGKLDEIQCHHQSAIAGVTPPMMVSPTEARVPQKQSELRRCVRRSRNPAQQERRQRVLAFLTVGETRRPPSTGSIAADAKPARSTPRFSLFPADFRAA
jgi:hypothetical protein